MPRRLQGVLVASEFVSVDCGGHSFAIRHDNTITKVLHLVVLDQGQFVVLQNLKVRGTDRATAIETQHNILSGNANHITGAILSVAHALLVPVG